MKNIFISVIIILFSILGYAQKTPISKKPKLIFEIKNKLATADFNTNLKKIENWYNEKYIKDENKEGKNLSTVKKEYFTKNGFLFHKNQIVDSLTIFYRKNKSIEYIVKIRKGLSVSQIINVTNNPRPSMYYISYDEKGNFNNYHNLNNISNLLDGNGYLKIYSYGYWDAKKQKYVEGILKEEGEVKHNFKFGKWKYYNEEEKNDSIKQYNIKDSVDIRFPHCIFNKKEPCYCEKK